MNIGGVNFSTNNRERNLAILNRHQEAKRFKNTEEQKQFMKTVINTLERHIDEMNDLVARTQDTAEQHRLLANIRANKADMDRYQRKLKMLGD